MGIAWKQPMETMMRTLSMRHDAVRIKGRRMILADVAAAVLRMIGAWRARAEQRRLLIEFDDRLLRDIGLTRSDVDAETLKSFWQR